MTASRECQFASLMAFQPVMGWVSYFAIFVFAEGPHTSTDMKASRWAKHDRLCHALTNTVGWVITLSSLFSLTRMRIYFWSEKL